MVQLFQGRPGFAAKRTQTPTAIVPCDGCVLCCKGGQVVTLFPEAGDDPESYVTEPNPEAGDVVGDIPGTRRMLAHRANGDCVYLGPSGCTIYARRPAVCREFDCAAQYASMSRAERRRWVKADLIDKEILDRGREIVERRRRPR